MTVPTPRLVVVLAVGLAPAAVPAAVDARLWPLWAALVAAVVLACALDAALTLPTSRLDVRVTVPAVLHIGDTSDAVNLAVELSTRGWRRSVAVDVLVEVDAELGEPAGLRTEVPAGASLRVEVALAPRRRGTHAVRAVWLRWSGPAGLLRTTTRLEVEEPVRVVPDVRSVQRSALRFFSRRDFLSGLKVERYMGEGSEFEQLREFAPGLDVRSVDWRATARHRRLLCREYRAERNHPVVLAFDTGHLMAEPLDGIPKLDHAINAALLLGYVALRTGDRVGLFAFDAEVRAFAHPRGNTTDMSRLLHGTSSLDYAAVETNFTLGLTALLGRLHRRTLVVLFTDFVDAVTAELMLENVAHLATRHVVLFVALRDASLDAVERGDTSSVRDVARAVVAGDLVRERELVLRRLARRGILVLDTPPGQLSTRLVNRYLDVKRRELVA